MSRKVSIQDIADVLGISRNTVSRAINSADGIAKSTKARILRKAEEMGYKSLSYEEVFASADRPLPGCPGEIALLTGAHLSHSHFAALVLDKFQWELSRQGYTMSTHQVTDSDFKNGTLPRTLNREQVRGIICVEMFDWDYDEMLCGLNIPILFLDGPSKANGRSLPADQLYMDSIPSVTRFVNEMLAKGKTRIGFVGNYDHCQSFYERYSAFALAMTLAGHPVDPRFVLKQNDPEALKTAVEELPELPEVFVCANDFLALDTMQGLAFLGKRVPEDVLICGFDDSAESRYVKPSLSTVHINVQIIALTAVFLLLSRIQEPELSCRTIHAETELILRESTKIE